MMFREQAQSCRQQASEFIGRPEAPFLLRVASAFDDLARSTEASLIRPAQRTASPPHRVG